MVRRRRGRQQGQAILVVSLVLFLLALAIGLVDGALGGRQRMTLEESRRVELEALADAAMAEALANLARDNTFAGARRHEFARGAIGSRIERRAGTRYRVAAVAALGAQTRVLEAEVDLPWGRPIVGSWRVAPAPPPGW